MATSRKTPNSVRQGGPEASHENAREPLRINKPTADDPKRRHSRVSGGGEHDSHHTHQPAQKGGGSHPADKE